METKLQVGVKIFIKNNEGKYLLLKRSPEKYKSVTGSWDIVGGRIDTGTPLMENLKREIYEETNMQLNPEPKLVWAQDILRLPEKHVVRLSYEGTAQGDIKLDTNENIEYAWLTVAEMLALEDLDPYVREILERGLIS